VLPFLVGNYRVFQLTLVLAYSIALLGLNMLTGYNGQISLGHGAFYAIGAYTAAILMDKVGMPYWMTIPIAGAVCLVAGFLFGLPALRLEGLYLALATFALGVAMPQILKHKSLEHWTGGVQGIVIVKPERPEGLGPVAGPVALLLHAGLGRPDVLHRVEPAARPDRPGDGRDPRPAGRGAGDGRQHLALQVADVRRLGALHRRRRRARLDRDPVRRARLVHDLPVDHAGRRRRVGGLASISGAIYGALFIQFIPNVADQLSKAAPWAIYGVFLLAFMYLMPTGVAGFIRILGARLRVEGGRENTCAFRGGRAQDQARRSPECSLPWRNHHDERFLRPLRWLVASAALAVASISPNVHAQAAKYGPGASATEIKLGQTMPYSGPASAYGTIGKLHQAYFKMINDNGGINGRKINLISLDDGYSPPKTVEQVRRLVEQDEVLALFQTLGTPPNSAIHKYVNGKKVPHLLLATGATKWGDPKNFPWTIGFNLSYQSEGEIYAKWLLKNKPAAKIAILYQNDDYGRTC
jgi:hypothetical protein